MLAIDKHALIWALVWSIAATVVSEINSGAFSTVWQYLTSNPQGETQGTIVVSTFKMTGRHGGHRYDIQYEYMVGDNSYIGTQINYSSRLENQERMVREYPVGKRVKVYYDVLRPDYSTLQRVTVGAGVYFQFVVLVLFFMFLLWLIPRTRITRGPFG